MCSKDLKRHAWLPPPVVAILAVIQHTGCTLKMYNGTLGSQAHRPYVVQELVGYQTPGQANYSIKKITSFATLEKGCSSKGGLHNHGARRDRTHEVPVGCPDVHIFWDLNEMNAREHLVAAHPFPTSALALSTSLQHQLQLKTKFVD